MQKNLYLHLGFHKTGSTSFQATCATGAEKLQSSGITYPSFKCDDRPDTIINHSIPIISMFSENPENYHINKRWGLSNKTSKINASYRQQFEEYLTSAENLCISGEGISLLSTQSLKRMITLIDKHNFKIHAIAILRSPYSALCSEIQQKIKIGNFNALISLNNSAKKTFNCEWYSKAKIASKLKSIFKNAIQFVPFESACLNPYGPAGFLVQEFLNTDPSAFKYSKENQSLDNLTVRLQNEMNKINPRFIEHQGENNPTFPKGELNPGFVELGKGINKNLVCSKKFALTEAEYLLIADYIRSESDKILKLTNIDYRGEKLTFSKAIIE